MRKHIVQIMVLMVLIIFSCSAPSPEKQNKPMILTTTSIIADIMHNLLGDMAEIKSLMSADVDPHIYKATFGDIRKINEADIIIFNGLRLEGKIEPLMQKISSYKKVFKLSDGLDKKYLMSADSQSLNFDPHIWFDIEMMKQAVNHICKELEESKYFDSNKLIQNKTNYIKQLNSLHSEIKKQFEAIPDNKRVLITAHDAFQYYGRSYHLTVMSLQGISTQADFGIGKVNTLIHYIVKHKIKAVFVESSISPRMLNAIVSGAAHRGHHLYIGGTLYSDALGVKGSDADTYLKMLSYNSKTIANALR